jgi:hypothetical protein
VSAQNTWVTFEKQGSILASAEDKQLHIEDLLPVLAMPV